MTSYANLLSHLRTPPLPLAPLLHDLRLLLCGGVFSLHLCYCSAPLDFYSSHFSGRHVCDPVFTFRRYRYN